MNRSRLDPASPTRPRCGASQGLLALAVAGTLLSCLGCTPPKVDDPPPAVPAYARLVARYNANLDGLDRMWSTAVVEMWWTDDQGKSHYQQGDDCKLMMVLPDRLALAVSKIQTVFWMGCDAQRYWLFDLRDEPRKGYVGRHDRLDAHAAASKLPLPVHPRQLPWLLGLVKLEPPSANAAAPPVKTEHGRYVIEPPETGVRLSIDPVSALPVTVALLDPDGAVVVQASLTGSVLVELGNVSRGGWPRIRTRTDVRLPDDAGRITIDLARMTDARAAIHERKRKAFKTAFDFEELARRLKIAEVIDLDQPPPPRP